MLPPNDSNHVVNLEIGQSGLRSFNPLLRDGFWIRISNSLPIRSLLCEVLGLSPDDPRLLKLRPSPYRQAEKPTKSDEIMVIGYVIEGEARAYPAALLDGHELVNDRIGDKPVTVGW